jgi:hypothetical protein
MHTGHRFFIVAPGRHRNGSGGRATHSPLLPSPLYPPPSPENTGVVGTMHSSSTASSSSSPPFPPGATPSSSVVVQHGLSLPSTCDGGGAARPQPPTGKKRRHRRGGCPRRAQRPLPRRPCATAWSVFLVTAVRSMVAAQASLAVASSSSSTSTSAMRSLSGLVTEPLPSNGGWEEVGMGVSPTHEFNLILLDAAPLRACRSTEMEAENLLDASGEWVSRWSCLQRGDLSSISQRPSIGFGSPLRWR